MHVKEIVAVFALYLAASTLAVTCESGELTVYALFGKSYFVYLFVRVHREL